MFLLVPAYPGCPGQMAAKWLLLLLFLKSKICMLHVLQMYKILTLDIKQLGMTNGYIAPVFLGRCHLAVVERNVFVSLSQ